MNEPNKHSAIRFRLVLAFFCCVFLISFVRPQAAHAQCDGCVQGAIYVQDDILGDLLIGIGDDVVAITAIYMPAFITALYGAGLPGVPGYGIDKDMQTGFKQVNKSIEILATTIMPMHAQMDADQFKFYGDVQGQADLAPNAVVSDKSIVCASTYAQALGDGMDSFVKAMTRAMMTVIRQRSTGVSTPVGIGTKAQKDCELAPFISNGPYGGGSDFSQRYPSKDAADNAAKCETSDANGAAKMPGYLIDGNSDMESVFGRMQLTVPDDVKLTPNHHIMFKPGNDGEWEYVAAWRYCEQFIPNVPPPPVNSLNKDGTTKMSLDMVRTAWSERRMTLAKSLSAVDSCMHAIADRTACSKGSEADFQISAMGDCWQQQDKACARLTRSPPSGMGIKATGNLEVDYALAHCDDDGLSHAAFEYAYSHRCNDINFKTVILPAMYADASALTKAQEACMREAHDDDQARLDERANFTTALRASSLQ